MGRVKRIWYISPMQAAKVQVSLRIRAVPPEPPLLAHTSSESREPFRQKARSLAPLNGWACAVKICREGMLEDTNLLDAPQIRVSLGNHRNVCLLIHTGPQISNLEWLATSLLIIVIIFIITNHWSWFATRWGFLAAARLTRCFPLKWTGLFFIYF